MLKNKGLNLVQTVFKGVKQMRVLSKLKVFLIIFGLFALASCGEEEPPVAEISGVDNGNVDNLAIKGVVGDNIPITRGEASRIIALSFYTQEEIKNLEKFYKFSDIEENENKIYINACVKLGYIKDNDKFRPEDYLTINEAQAIANNISKNSVVLKFSVEEQKSQISYALFVKTVTKVLDNEDLLVENDINYKNLIVLATKENNEKLGDNIITDYGVMKTSYLDYAEQLNAQVLTLVRNDIIICSIEIVDNAPKLEDVYILQTSGKVLTVFAGGLTRQYQSDKDFDKDYRGNLCDVQIEGNKVVDLVIHEDYVKKEVKLIDIENGDNKFIEVEGDSNLTFSDYYQLKVFRDYGEKVRSGEFADIVIGDDNTKFFMNEKNQIIGCVVSESPQSEVIRVLLTTTNFASKFHKSVEVTSTKEFYVKNGSFEKTINAGDVYLVPEDSKNRVYIEPSENSELILKNLERSSSEVSYQGSLEVKKFEEGFVVTNVLNVEDYLKRVVPSEMPSSYHIEALKAQAVTARSFAMKTLFQTAYKKYGSNLDDSTASQVYNNVAEVEAVNEAIKATDGVVLTYDSVPVSTNFYSTSSGVGASSGDVWADFKNSTFPTTTPEYLSSKALVSKDNTPSLETEEDVAKFLKSTDVKAVDSKFPWFRWNYEMTVMDIQASINKNINSRYSVNSFMILTKEGDKFVEKPIESIGAIRDINVLSRGDGGIITAIEIVAEDKNIKIMGEYNIRFILKPVGYDGKEIVITKNDGSTSKNYALIPSAFFVFDKVFDEDKNLKSIKVFGGGNGHGVGMSQNGAEELAQNGVSYQEILKYFYTGVEIAEY